MVPSNQKLLEAELAANSSVILLLEAYFNVNTAN